MNELKNSSFGEVIFNSGQLPNNEHKYYQFVYVSSNQYIRGCSSPFKFKKPYARDSVSVDDDEQDDSLFVSHDRSHEDKADLELKCEI